MIRFGPSGIPLSCKGRTLRDGIEDVHTLGLTALEVQLVRTNVNERHATDEDVGKVPMEIEDELIIEIRRGAGKQRKATTLYEAIEKGDIILSLTNPNANIAKNFIHLKQLGEIAKNLDVVLSIHTPYYMDLVANNDLTERSMESIRWAGILANIMDAQIIVTHMGMYGNLSKKDAAKSITANIALIQDWYNESGIKIPLGLETSGRQEIFGSFEEIEAICDEIKGPVPVINFPHVHARGNGALKKKEDFQELFDRASRFTKGRFYTHFSGVEHENGNEIRYTPIKKGDLKFEPLAECILDNDIELTVISGSPLLEHDAMYMKVILERVLSKQEAKAERQKAKEEAPPPAKPSKKSEKKPVPKPAAKKPVPKSKKPAPKPKSTPKPKSGSKVKVPVKKPAPKSKFKPAAKKPAPKKQPAKKADAKPAPKKPLPKARPKPRTVVKKPAPKVPVRKPASKSKVPAKKSAPKTKAPPKKPAPKAKPKPAAKKAVANPKTKKPAPKKPAAKKPASKKKR